MLYICATPIGNLKDISYRAIEILKSSDIILCEDTRISARLLNHYQIFDKRLVALHEHNENETSQRVIAWLNEGKTIVQISDAGTPGISDPGARLCNKVTKANLKISPIPGACAYISLLSVSGLIETSSLFYGFLVNKTTGRRKQLKNWQTVDYAVCLYESPHRIIECLQDIIETLGKDKLIIMGRELTKQFETIKKAKAAELLEFIQADLNQQKGEFALLIMPNIPQQDSENYLSSQQLTTLQLLAKELPTKKAVNLTHQLVGGNKDQLYQYLLDNK